MDLPEIKNFILEARENVRLADYSTFKIGGTARYFCNAKNKEEFRAAISAAVKLKISFLVLGGGSNTLIDDGIFNGLVIVFKGVPQKEDFFAKQSSGDYFAIEADGGWPLFFLAQSAAENSLSGMEWAVGIPGTIAGAINGNAGAFKSDISGVIEEVGAIKLNAGGEMEEKNIKKEYCGFGYRSSIFKNDPGLFIVSAKIKLKKDSGENISAKMKEYINKRKNKYPSGFSIGSIFKNYYAKPEQNIFGQHPELKEVEREGMVPAAYLIDQCGLKGKRIGGAEVANEHANFIINCGNAKASEVKELIKLIKGEVDKKFGIKLQEEIKFLNF
ncbi:MAG: UDP-N-acetylmuramate dehydrogenase [Candidatus Pacebacteria bacterium]|nr:UDP-N-acetylmuramate dehydrogenase [Candidatus Paceibacterota bacterium]